METKRPGERGNSPVSKRTTHLECTVDRFQVKHMLGMKYKAHKMTSS